MSKSNEGWISTTLLILLGIIFGVVVALAWFFGFAVFTRIMVPYALAVAVFLFIVTAIFRAVCGNHRRECSDYCITPTCLSVSKYSAIVLISAAISIVASLIFLATDLTFTAKVILAFTDAIAFDTMLIAFLAMILKISYRRK